MLLLHALYSCGCTSFFFVSLSYDEEQAQSENTDLRSRSGQSLGSKSTRASSVRPVPATWKWGQDLGHILLQSFCHDTEEKCENMSTFWLWLIISMFLHFLIGMKRIRRFTYTPSCMTLRGFSTEGMTLCMMPLTFSKYQTSWLSAVDEEKGQRDSTRKTGFFSDFSDYQMCYSCQGSEFLYFVWNIIKSNFYQTYLLLKECNEYEIYLDIYENVVFLCIIYCLPFNGATVCPVVLPEALM